MGSSSTARRRAQISRYTAALTVIGLFALAAPIAIGCGTSPVGVGACKQVEEARCRRAPACGVNLEPPYSTAGGDVSACIRFYDVACLHGLVVADPGADAVNACVASIEVSPCDGAVPLFETAPACAWLTKLTGVEAGTGSDATEDSPDAESDASDSGSDSGSVPDSASDPDAAEASLR